MIQFQNFPVSPGDPTVMPSLPQMPDQEAAKVFQQAYGQPNDVLRTVLQSVDVPQPTDASQPVPSVQPTGVPQPVGDDPRASRPFASRPVESRPVESRPVELPPATPATFAKVVTENAVIAKDLPQPVGVPHLVGDDPRASRPVELPPVTPETLAKAVAENVVIAKDLPQPVDVPQPVGDDPRASRPVESRPVALPLATPATFAKVVAENAVIAKELPPAVELPQATGVDFLVPQPAVVSQSVDLPQPVGDDPRASRPVELPPATPETLAKVVAENAVIAKELPQPEDSVLQAVPEAVAAPSFMTPGVAVQDDIPVAGVAAKISTEVPRTAGDIVLEAASAVADALLVTPSLMRGEGEVVVQLKPDVLDGSRVRIQVQGNEMKIEFKPVTETIAQLLTEAHPQLVQHLSARIPAFEFAVTVLPANVAGRQFVRRGGKTAGGEI